MMKTGWAAMVIAGALTLAGCSNGQASGAQPPRATATPMDQVFASTVRARFPSMTTAVMMQTRQEVCAVFKADPTPHGWVTVVKTFTDNGIAAEDAGYFIGAAVRTGCPQYQSALPGE